MILDFSGRLRQSACLEAKARGRSKVGGNEGLSELQHPSLGFLDMCRNEAWVDRAGVGRTFDVWKLQTSGHRGDCEEGFRIVRQRIA